MSRIRCYRPRSCGVTFHVAGTSAAKSCQEAVKRLPKPAMKGYIEATPEPLSSEPLITNEDGTLILQSGLVPPVPGAKAIVRDRKTGQMMELEFQEGTRRIQTSSVFRWKFYRKDEPGNLKTMLWDSSNEEISPYEIVEYV